MKKIYLYLLLPFTFNLLNAAAGCMDNSRHLKEPYDAKEYHFVSCACPCKRHMAEHRLFQARARCPVCRHFHDPLPIIIITKTAYTKETANVVTYKRKEQNQLRKLFGNLALNNK